jgi:hypothetical protein
MNQGNVLSVAKFAQQLRHLMDFLTHERAERHKAAAADDASAHLCHQV